MKYREPTMLGKKAKNSYKELVRYYKYINDTTRVEDFLDTLFSKALEDLKTKHYSVCATSKAGSDLTLDQAKAIKLLDQKYGFNNWTDIVKSKIKLPLTEIHEIIEQAFNVTGRDAVTKHKKKLLEVLNLKQIRKGNDHYIVHVSYIDPDEKLRKYYDEKETLQNRYEQLIGIIKEEKGLSPEEIQSYIAGDLKLKEMINKSSQLFYSQHDNIIYHREHVSDSHRWEAAAQLAQEVKGR